MKRVLSPTGALREEGQGVGMASRHSPLLMSPLGKRRGLYNRRWFGGFLSRLPFHRQKDVKPSELTNTAFHFDLSRMLFDNLLDDGQAQSCSITPCRVKWVKNDGPLRNCN